MSGYHMIGGRFESWLDGLGRRVTRFSGPYRHYGRPFRQDALAGDVIAFFDGSAIEKRDGRWVAMHLGESGDASEAGKFVRGGLPFLLMEPEL